MATDFEWFCLSKKAKKALHGIVKNIVGWEGQHHTLVMDCFHN